MCYAKPGPMCSNHARKVLNRAIAEKDAARIKSAQDDFDRTPAGIKGLRKRGKEDEAKRAENARRGMLTAYRAQKWQSLPLELQGKHALENPSPMFHRSMAKEGDTLVLSLLLLNPNLSLGTRHRATKRLEELKADLRTVSGD